jgi:GT2 family glycosyltransferase/glycosyltransferase involved in cell wall biosynthesis
MNSSLPGGSGAAAPGVVAPRAVDIIVPIYRNAELVRACVDSLLAHLDEIAARSPRLVLINDSPDDAPVAALLGQLQAGPHAARLVMLVNDKNLGFVGAVNRGLALALKDRRDVLLVNSDTVTFPGTMRELLAAANADAQIGFASPRSNNASVCSLPHFHGGRMPTPEEARARWAALSSSMPAWHFAPTAVGFYMYIAHSVLANHGGLRTDFGAGYEEENELVMRAGKVGRRAIFVNRSFAYHAGSASFALTDIDLGQHRHDNHVKMTTMHPEFVPLVRRYEASPHYRAERMMSGLLPDERGRLRLVFDLTGLGKHHNGTNEHAIAVVRHLAAHWSDRFRVAGIGNADSFEFHGLHEVEHLHREEPGAPGLHAVAVRIAQPFDLHHVNVMEGLAPVNLYAMLDTISEDCGPLSAEGAFIPLWDYVAGHANALLYNSVFSQRQFQARHPAARALPDLALLLSTRLAEYRRPSPATAAGRHVLVLGNHFPHKASDPVARQIASTFPTLETVVLGAETFQRGNLSGFRSGTLESTKMDALFAEASVVVLPSHIEGFGFGLLHALAAGKPVVARRIPATEEILATLDSVEGVFLFDSDADIAVALEQALKCNGSKADDRRGPAWADWADGVGALCLRATRADDVFPRLVARIAAGDLLRRAAQPGRTAAPGEPVPSEPARASAAAALPLPELMRKDGPAFVEHAYATLLRRPADASGLAFYSAQLESGTDKREVIRALSSSPEARVHGGEVEGLAALLATLPSRRRSLLRRLVSR